MRPSFVVTAFVVFLVAAVGMWRAARSGTPADETVALTRSLSELEQRLGSTAPQLLPILGSLADLQFEQGQFADATAQRRRSLKIAIAAYGNASLPAAKAMAALATLYIERRRYLDAEPLAVIAANLLRDRLGESNPALTPILADRARIALARGDKGDARKWAEEAVEIDKKSGTPQSAHLRVLGAVLVAQNQFDESEGLLRQALALARADGNQFETARSLAALSDIDLKQKRFDEALPLIEEAVLIDQTNLGPTHPLIAEDFHHLGLIYLAVKRPTLAAKTFESAIALLDRGAGRNTPTLAYIQLDLARAEHILGHVEKSRSLFTAARRILNAAEDEERDRQRSA
jgi:tetratricopeptide (TPR) repeat protein